MDRQEFFDTVLPGQDCGTYILVDLGGSRPRTLQFGDHSRLDRGVTNLQRSASNNIYFACSTFTGKKRVASEAAYAKALWVDVDVDPDKPKKAYPDRKTAAAAIVQACKDTGMPQPLIVSSGGGYHLYWPFTEAIKSALWKELATALKTALKAVSFKQDPVATADAARILRPVGTINPKNGQEVKVLRACPLYDPMELGEILKPFTTDTDEDEIDLSAHSSSGMFDDSLDLSVTNYPTASAHVIRSKCIALNDVVSNADTASEPEWRGMLGLVKYCTEGEALAHEWSKPHPDYIPDETQAKLDGWQTPPTSCEYFDDLDMCTGCRYKSPTLKSPIMLGTEDVIEVSTGPKTAAASFKVSIPWPFGWDKSKGQMYRKIKTDDGIEKRPVCSSLFVVKTRIRSTEGPWEMLCMRQKYYDKDGIEPDEWEEFRIPAKHIGRPSDLAADLASYEVYGMGKTGNSDLSDLFKAYGDQLRASQEETLSYRSFGFNGDRTDIVGTSTQFIIGTRAVDEDAEWTDVLCSDHVPTPWRIDFGQRGTWQEWAELVNRAYNVEGAESLQFAICCGFAAPLTALLPHDWWHGCAVAYVGDSGTGKSTACKVACSIYGKGSLFEILADRVSGSTVQAQLQKLATMRHLPLLFDETSTLSTEEMVQMLYAMSSGKDKERLDVTGKPKPSEGYWDTISFLTTNKSLLELLARAEHHGVQEATMVRMFEIRLEEYLDADFFTNERKHLLDIDLPKLYGAAGERWLPWVLKNIDKIAGGVRRVEVELRGGKDMLGNTLERFQHQLIASAVFAGRAAKRLGLVDFDMNRVRDFALHNLARQRDERASISQSAMELVAIYLSAHHDHIIKSRHYQRRGKTPRDKVAMIDGLRGEVLGRIAYDNKLIFLCSNPFLKWLSDKGMSGMAILRELYTAGALVPGEKIHRESNLRDYQTCVTVGKGTNITTGQQWCIELDFDVVAKENPLHLVQEPNYEQQETSES